MTCIARVVCIGVGLLLVVSSASAQPFEPVFPPGPPGMGNGRFRLLEESHAPIDSGSETDYRSRLSERLGNRQTDSKLISELLKQWKSGKSPEEMLKAIPELQDPKVLERLKSFAEGKTGGLSDRLSPEQLEKLSKMTQDPTTPPKESNDPESEGKPKLEDPMTTTSPDPKQQTIPEAEPVKSSELPTDERTQNWLQWFEDHVGPIEDFPAVGDFLKDLGKGDLQSWLPGDQNWAASLNEWKGEIQSLKSWLDQSAKSGNFSFPELSFPKMPNFSMNGGNSSSGGSFGGGSFAPSGDVTWAPVILLGILMIGGMIYWASQMKREPEAPQRMIPIELGPWPVDPSRIQSAAQFLQAFEYLALSRCGLVAQSWNHQEIEWGLARQFPEARDQAHRLANAYAFLRYAPNPTGLPDSEFQSACQILQTFAQVSLA
ncbi:hypothetical protein [Tuwongella immobilis]|uniref:DUF4129 domain-containing protein n=1 Tax=Tuwongella immobilis TaxID=692036 RepID=A0A6C2YP00_9BACT|nr:hypothetical protein [Tuwongella immobilis]VIP03021.1 unnamed protein product [Tuwongella immobilis]VTS03151.1 unnamed protein product [Tuwongella immobilis]